ncbi:MAG TPA: efflux RND transporter periplasmic adaptor subunit [Cyclobacteriaceae bacterium]|jgi:membrane fusion protein (multidrug efflux system)|nr:efflux RND transporter periplasmic adaptor subunit [Cytophagales bacterium]HMR56181.1 efflux RND transporter periplasmic adaptor subunit [Cyclobacteriaceae bacterium]HNT49558.1 efflux RND transporter periplasmic adaptor subunit [Cyclobacteriaceae bacterium]HRE65455.1 efflux RND transporter periplasmic adaptor subunit [Cyclobacteriaceae bacterium]HRF32627.1 efflux RND transporter periplasmic adaptor subunit [Cyclobacteriaceae bacterium]
MNYIHKALPLVITCSFIWSCKNATTQVNSPAEFLVTRVISKDTIIYNEYVSDIHAIRNVEIRARVQGYLESIHIDEGAQVKKGQLLFTINDEEYRAAVNQARASLHSAEAEATALALEVDRVKILVDKNVVSETELRLANAKYTAAKARIEEEQSVYSNASIRLSHTVIRSPFDGVIDRIPFKIGSLINEGSLLTSVSDTHEMFAYFKVSEQEYLKYRQSNTSLSSEEVELVLADNSFHKHKGRIETMEGEFDATTGTIAIRARFPNPEHLLKHGSSGKVRTGNVLKDAILVPQKSTTEIQDRTFVYLVGADKKTSLKSFTPLMRFSHFYIVAAGLKPGDEIIYEGIQNVQDGLEIKPVFIPLDSIVAYTRSNSLSITN